MRARRRCRSDMGGASGGKMIGCKVQNLELQLVQRTQLHIAVLHITCKVLNLKLLSWVLASNRSPLNVALLPSRYQRGKSLQTGSITCSMAESVSMVQLSNAFSVGLHTLCCKLYPELYDGKSLLCCWKPLNVGQSQLQDCTVQQPTRTFVC